MIIFRWILNKYCTCSGECPVAGSRVEWQLPWKSKIFWSAETLLACHWRPLHVSV